VAGAAGLSLFVVDADSPGITIDRTEPLGWRAADPATVRFDAVRVPLDRVVGRLASGFYQLMRGFELERVVAAVLALSGADRSLQLTREHLVGRGAFGALDDTEVARAFRDARAATIAEGPSEVMRDIISRLEIDEATNVPT